MCACACLSEAPRGSGPGPLGPFLLPLTRGFGQIWRGHKITTYPFSPRKNGRKGMAQSQGWVRRYFKAFCKGFFVAVPVAVTFLDRVACVARVEGASMQPSLNPGGSQSSDVVLLNHWKVRNFEVQRGDIVSLVITDDTSAAVLRTVLGVARVWILCSVMIVPLTVLYNKYRGYVETLRFTPLPLVWLPRIFCIR
ncbi:mitochondrial inner membrane protease subunit 2 isoform X6 [Bubalus kerabau]|uniref:mitochondrial inner membrane protease subunit 2 isoform X6 n=1 Tax=Bubalus carabanensis TaxID=3119969 RepID=UPI00244E84DA|nr:mitochondrial inner membrane protease subunit 2 isoform X6 [Bubalus carabanensis]